MQKFSEYVQVAEAAERTVRVIAYDPAAMQYLYIGLDEKVYNRLKSKKKLTSEIEEHDKNNMYIGTDGIALMTSKGPCDFEKK